MHGQLKKRNNGACMDRTVRQAEADTLIQHTKHCAGQTDGCYNEFIGHIQTHSVHTIITSSEYASNCECVSLALSQYLAVCASNCMYIVCQLLLGNFRICGYKYDGEKIHFQQRGN